MSRGAEFWNAAFGRRKGNDGADIQTATLGMLGTKMPGKDTAKRLLMGTVGDVQRIQDAGRADEGSIDITELHLNSENMEAWMRERRN